ncbi:hypothetical protein [Rhizobium laguerreae]|uniref:hypothetical protein n=1 Tax=Rhizobium laguerreae TaxID=1076926 RepID=UPI001FEEFEB8|nr:hypothetical protein [Rhizobium laguerreae]
MSTEDAAALVGSGKRWGKPNVSIIVLPADLATRMGSNGGHKLLACLMERRSALVAQASTALSIIVGAGYALDTTMTSAYLSL